MIGAMNATSPLPTDPVALVRQLDPEAIRKRLAELDGEREALRVLLRAAQRARRDDTPPRCNEGGRDA
jgi:ribosomal 50S subunit-associated protein YjgA (DUF615 family)